MLRMHPEGLLPPVLLTWTPALQHTGYGPVRKRGGGQRGEEPCTTHLIELFSRAALARLFGAADCSR